MGPPRPLRDPARRLRALPLEWLDTWRATAPDDPDALLVAARLAVHRHWDSPARTELLRQVIPSVVAAAETAGPADPVPWRTALDAARGAGAEHAEFERLWEQAVRRSPHHYGSHVAALEYLAAASSDGHGECLDFAETAAQEAPEEALVRALPLHAAFTCLTATGTGTGTDARTGGATTAAVRTHRPVWTPPPTARSPSRRPTRRPIPGRRNCATCSSTSSYAWNATRTRRSSCG